MSIRVKKLSYDAIIPTRVSGGENSPGACMTNLIKITSNYIVNTNGASSEVSP
jgi:hypothetical protein